MLKSDCYCYKLMFSIKTAFSLETFNLENRLCDLFCQNDRIIKKYETVKKTAKHLVGLIMAVREKNL